MEHNSRFFANKDCEYYPCHPGLEDFNCLFCYCPLNYLEHCPGKPEFIKSKDGKVIKNCMGCDFPHRPENYDIIINYIKKNMPVFQERLLKKAENPKPESAADAGKEKSEEKDLFP